MEIFIMQGSTNNNLISMINPNMTKGEIIRHYTLSNVITIRSLKYHSLSFVNKQTKPNNPESDAASRLNSQFTGNIGDGGTHFVLFCFVFQIPQGCN